MGGFSSDAISFQQSYPVKSIAQLQLGRNICGALRSLGRSLLRHIKLLSLSSLAPRKVSGRYIYSSPFYPQFNGHAH
ncbi:hypothetical protein ECG_06840 [Echinococcus granulosus]|nr:hypothetical protein ECG_06840 [Echinococcus granulosus]